MYYKYFVISIKLYIFVYIKNIIMPKSRHRKNHKKKVTAWKERTKQKITSANKEITKMQEKMMEDFKKKQETEKAVKDLPSPNPETL